MKTAPDAIVKPTPSAAAAPSPLGELAGCVRFFSRLAVPPLGPGDDPSAMPDFARAARALPAAGAVIALPAALAGAVLDGLGAPGLLAAFLVLGVLVLVTGGLHEDGLGDLADGFGGGATREAKLAIMKDSRIGAYGALALILVVGLKAAAIAALADARSALFLAAALLIAAMASRLAMVFLWFALPNVRPGGLAATAGRPARQSVTAAAATVVVALVLVLPVLGPAAAMAAAAATVIATGLTGVLAERQIGGQTGDVLGAAQQIAEAAILTALALTTT